MQLYVSKSSASRPKGGQIVNNPDILLYAEWVNLKVKIWEGLTVYVVIGLSEGEIFRISTANSMELFA